jgi:hypothetical protein
VVAGCEGVESDPLPPILRGRVLTAKRFTPDAYELLKNVPESFFEFTSTT